jgi:hypothetical protein
MSMRLAAGAGAIVLAMCAIGHAQAPAPFDLASAEMGGRVEWATSHAAEPDWVPFNLIARTPFEGWSAQNLELPQEIVFSFFGRQPALVSSVHVNPTARSVEGGIKDVEIWTSAESATDGFTRVAAASLAREDRLQAIAFPPVEARFVKLRIVSAYTRVLNDEATETPAVASQVGIYEARRPGYVPLLERNPDLAALVKGTIPSAPADAAQEIPVADPSVCAIRAPGAPKPPKYAESRRVLVLSDSSTFYAPTTFKPDRDIGNNDYSLFGRVELTWMTPHVARPALLLPSAGFDTVAISQICAIDEVVSKEFKQALMAWVAAGHKLIIHDSDGCAVPDRTDPNRIPDYSFLPYRLVTSNPGKAGVDGDGWLLENSALASARPADAAFVDMPAWLKGEQGNYNELGDSNVIVADDPRWCGSILGTNALKKTGFAHAYARYGRGLIIYNGFDLEHVGVPAYERLLTRELAQPFDPDHLPCSQRAGAFLITSDLELTPELASAGTLDYPIAVRGIGDYGGAVTLEARVQPPAPAVRATLAEKTLDLTKAPNARTSLRVVAGPGASRDTTVVVVSGRDAAGRSNVLCLRLAARP